MLRVPQPTTRQYSDIKKDIMNIDSNLLKSMESLEALSLLLSTCGTLPNTSPRHLALTARSLSKIHRSLGQLLSMLTTSGQTKSSLTTFSRSQALGQ